MSVGERAARLAVHVAVLLLPDRLRDRYREQWYADLRDAAAAGIRRSDIATGSLAFALTLDRASLVAAAGPERTVVLRRERLASALTLGTAVVALSYVGTVVGFGRTLGTGAGDFVLAFASFLLASYLVLAPVVAVVMVSVTRGVDRSVRSGVWLLVVASLAPLVRPIVDGGSTAPVQNIYLTPGAAVYVVALTLCAVAAVWLVRYFRASTRGAAGEASAAGAFAVARASAETPASRRPAAVAGALVVGALVGVGVANLAALAAAQSMAGAAFGERIAESNPADAADFSAAFAAGESAAVVAVVVWGVAGAVVTLALAAVGFARGATVRGAAVRTGAALCVLLISHASVSTYVQLMSVGGVGLVLPVPELLLVIGRAGLVAIVLVELGGVRLTRSRLARAPSAV